MSSRVNIIKKKICIFPVTWKIPQGWRLHISVLSHQLEKYVILLSNLSIYENQKRILSSSKDLFSLSENSERLSSQKDVVCFLRWFMALRDELWVSSLWPGYINFFIKYHHALNVCWHITLYLWSVTKPGGTRLLIITALLMTIT